MKNHFLLFAMLGLAPLNASAQNDTSTTGTFWHPNPASYQVKHAVEVESLVPMFFTADIISLWDIAIKNSGSGRASSMVGPIMRKLRV